MTYSACMTSYVIMSYLLWPPPASLACLSDPVAMGYGLCVCVPSPDKDKQVRIFQEGWGGEVLLVVYTQQGQTSGSGGSIKSNRKGKQKFTDLLSLGKIVIRKPNFGLRHLVFNHRYLTQTIVTDLRLFLVYKLYVL